MSASGVISPAQPEKILKELGKVWMSLGKEEKEQGKPTVLRACAMTLIVATDDVDESSFTASQTLIELMHEHPSRGIVLRVTEDAGEALEARVLAQCWKPFGKAQQICCEQIEISSTAKNWPYIGPTVVGIIAADLPVVLWCRQKTSLSSSATTEQTTGLASVMSLASKVIIDTDGFDASTALPILQQWRANGCIVADLEWTRLTPWRESLANVFDDPTRQKAISNFKKVEVSYTDDKATASVLYMGAWLAGVLKADLSFAKTDGYGPGLHAVVLRADSETIELVRTSKECMTLKSDGRERKYNIPESTLYNLMNEELAVLEPDRIFDAAFSRSLGLAK